VDVGCERFRSAVTGVVEPTKDGDSTEAFHWLVSGELSAWRAGGAVFAIPLRSKLDVHGVRCFSDDVARLEEGAVKGYGHSDRGAPGEKAAELRTRCNMDRWGWGRYEDAGQRSTVKSMVLVSGE